MRHPTPTLQKVPILLLLFATLAGCQKKDLSATVRLSVRMTGIEVTRTEEGQTATIETLARYSLTTGTVSANSLPTLDVNIALLSASTESLGEPVNLTFGQADGVQVKRDGASAIWNTKSMKGGVPHFEVRLTGMVQNFDTSAMPCGSKVPIVISSNWMLELVNGDGWKIEGKSADTATIKTEAFVSCGPKAK